jgi:hypothetical protein
MKFLTFLFLLIVLQLSIGCSTKQQLIGGTTVLVLTTPNIVVMAADSKEVQYANDTADYVNVCKIKNIGPYYYAITGYYTLTGSTYNSIKILNESLSNSVTKTLENFISKIKHPMESALKNVKENQPYLFQTIKGTNLMSLILVGFHNDSSDVKWVEFKVDTISGLYPEPLIRDVPRSKFYLIKFGEYDSINTFLRTNPNYLSQNNALKALTELINMESIRSPNKVGGPVDMILISKDTSVWLQKKDICN